MTRTPSAGRGAWTEPGAFEVVPGVFRIPLPLPNDGLTAVNVYALVSDEELVLIDSGWAVPEGRKALSAGLASIDRELGDIDRFLITHVHRDHYTHAIELRREFGMAVSLGANERAFLDVAMNEPEDPLLQHLQFLRMQGGGVLADIVAARQNREADSVREHLEYPDEWFGEESISVAGFDLGVLPTPGHTRGHVCFFDGDRQLLFAGDHVLPTITPSVAFEVVLSDNPLGDFLGSLALVRSMPDALLLPAHGPVAPSAHARVDELLDHHGSRLALTERAVEAGAATAYEAAGLITWTRRERDFRDLDWFNQMLAVNETQTHLILLAEQGRLRRELIDGVWFFGVA